ncbi:MAG: Chromosomal replication initiator protein DnaA [Candidatus Peregrinibacteria bacterium GW2011_GWA2_47_7]|nr:MAG: Chromosomal replication initiator protein DnaA [Candidatus Peregrinibacteria bacterium GW2011_GWA2_47_7]
MATKDLKSLWKGILETLGPTMNRAHFITWFAHTAILSLEHGVLTLGLPNHMALNWVKTHYAAKILSAAQQVESSVENILFEVDGALPNTDDFRSADVSALCNAQVRSKTRKLPNKNEVSVGEHGIRGRLLNPKYTLENFVVGKDNQLAHAACSAVVTRPGLVEAIKKYNAQDFRKRYRSIDCLIIDDIQFFANKERTQEEFFHTFNELYDANKQIIISSDRPPKELSGIEDRLKSRFESGMVVEVYFADYETRLAILQEKCREREVILPPDVLAFIASNVHDSIRELEGVLTQAIAQAKLEQSTPTVRSVAKIMHKLSNGKGEFVGVSKEDMEHTPTIRTSQDVMNIVSQYYRISPDELIGECRKKEVLLPRQVAMYLIYEILKYSYDTIGDSFGGRNHTTVMHAYNKVKNQLHEDRKLVQDMYALKREMGL